LLFKCNLQRYTAGELVGLFAAVGRISGWSESLLGATVFAWWGSAGRIKLTHDP
jgi:hypothetical protein